MKVGQKEAYKVARVYCPHAALGGWGGSISTSDWSTGGLAVWDPSPHSAQGDHSQLIQVITASSSQGGRPWTTQAFTAVRMGLPPSLPLLPAKTHHTRKPHHSHPKAHASRAGKSPWECGGQEPSWHSDQSGLDLVQRRQTNKSQAV